MVLRCVLPFAVLASTVSAEILEFELKSGQNRAINLPSQADESHFADPRGYADHGTRVRDFIQRVELVNSGDKPLTGRLLLVNGRDWSNLDSLQRALGISAEPERHAQAIERLYTFWKDHRSHAGAWMPLANEPFAALNFWGYSLCGEDTQAFARLAFGSDIPARFVPLNGHLAAEYRYDGGWHMVDGDQNAVYLKLDNKTLAGYDDLRADPFLALRTKVFGKHSPQELSASAFNTSLLEHINPPEEAKALKLKAGPAPLNVFTLQPGDTLVWHYDTPPATPVGQLSTEKPEELKAAALATIEHRTTAKAQPKKADGEVTLTSPYPIWKALNVTTGEAVALKAGEAVFKVNIAVKAETDQLAIFSQCSRLALPAFHRDENLVQLGAEKGNARVSIHWTPAKGLQLATTTVSTKTPAFAGPPAFALTAKPRAGRLWWQVSPTKDFKFIAPSLEGILPWTPELRFDPLTDTFLSPGRPYYIRVKARNEGAWGEWSEPVEFRVNKPAAPSEMTFERVTDHRVKLRWKGPAKDIEYDLYGSNRRDFVPEVFAEDEIVAMKHTAVTERRPNKNLVATVRETETEFAPQHRFFRLIARRGNARSVPSPLFVLPADLGKDIPPATVLQSRVRKEGNKDVYEAKEEKLP